MTTMTRATRISHSDFKTDMEMNGQTERCGQKRPKNSMFIKPTALNALQLRETGPAINIRGGFVIVVDPWSGIWLKWMPGSFDETLQSGRYDFLIDLFAGDICATDEYREKVVLWIKKSFRKNYL